MHTIIRLTLLVTAINHVTGELIPGDLTHFGSCALNFLRLTNISEYVDITETLILLNHEIQNGLIYTMSDKLPNSILTVEAAFVRGGFHEEWEKYLIHRWNVLAQR